MTDKQVYYSKYFERNFKKRILKNKQLAKKYYERLELFLRAPKAPLLNDHALQGTLTGYRSFSITNSIRVVYIEVSSELHFINVGTHDQVYRN